MRSILYDFTPAELQELLDTSDSYKDVLIKIGLVGKGRNCDTLKKIIKEYGLDETQLNLNRKRLFSKCSDYAHKSTIIPIEDILNNNISKPYSSTKLLKRLIKDGYKEYKCEICGLFDWLGKPISLQLDHIDGNHYNNNLSNLQILCPNCHSQTDTFAGRNVNHNKTKKEKRVKYVKEKVLKQSSVEKSIKLPPISREDLKHLIRTTPFLTIGKQFGVSDNAIRKWCDKYKLPRKVSEIKKYTDEEWEDI